MFSLSTLFFKTVDWSLTKRTKQWERNVVLGGAGVCEKGRNANSPKNAYVGGYYTNYRLTVTKAKNWDTRLMPMAVI